jgi:hypothetical protein
MFQGKNDGRYRLEFLFEGGALGWLVTDDKAKIDAWWNVFSVPLRDTGHRERCVGIAMFDNNEFVKEHRYELPVAA